MAECPECKSPKVIRDYVKGEVLCANCGLIIQDNIEDPRAPVAYDQEQMENRSHSGAPSKFGKIRKGLVTEIDMYNRDIRGNKIDYRKIGQFQRMRKFHRRDMVSGSAERNIAIAFGELDRVSSYMGLQDSIRESAALLYRNCVKAGLTKGRLIESLVAAVVYATCRINGIPRTLDEISQVSGIEKKEVGRAFRFVKNQLGLEVPLSEPDSYVPKFIVALKLSGRVEAKALNILNQAKAKGLISGRGPLGVAAAAVYMASAMQGEWRTQHEVADVAGVTEVTIRNRYRELKHELHLKVKLQ